MRLPVAPAALPGSDLTFDRLGVAMDAQGRLLVADEALDEEAASAWWADQAKARRAGLETLGEPAAGDDLLPTVVILRADRAASYGAVRRTLAEAQDQGLRPFQPGRLAEAHAMSTGMGLSLSAAESTPSSEAADTGRASGTELPARSTRGGDVPGDAHARHGVPAPGVLHPDVQGPLGRDPPGPRPARDAGRLTRGGPKAKPNPGRLGPSTPTWKTTCWSAPRPTTWAT